MKKVVYGLMALAMLLAFVPAVAIAHTEADPFVTQLIADGGSPDTAVDVGEVQVWNDESYLYVKYVIDADLTPADPSDDGVPTLLVQTHLQVATSVNDIPQTKKGSPIPGQFEYNTVHEPGVVEYTYQIPLDWAVDTPLYIAAHSVVQKLGGLAGLELALPGSVTMSVTYPYSDGPSYFPHTYITGEPLSGDYLGWCVDTDHTINQNTVYTANVYSSYESLPAGLVEHPENFDLVNWIINQGYIGQTSSACGGTYNYSDVQYAIWTLIDDAVSTSGLYGLSVCRANEIVAAAQAAGEGFAPGCGDKVAVVLAPVDGSQVIIAQVIFAEVEVPCYNIEETAWGEGAGFPGADWSMYFIYTVQGELPPVEWPVGGTTTVAFEDLALGGGNDWDYNDWVADIYTEATYWGTTAEPGTDLIQMAFTVTPQAKLAGYHHAMHFDSDTFGCDGTYELTWDGVPAGSGSYDDALGLDVILILDTNSPNEATLTIMFDPPCAFDWSAYDPYGSYHGEGLFFDPWIKVINTGEEIHQGDVRMLTVPTDWVWPAESQAIWLAYPKVGPVTDPYAGPVFVPYWWTP